MALATRVTIALLDRYLISSWLGFQYNSNLADADQKFINAAKSVKNHFTDVKCFKDKFLKSICRSCVRCNEIFMKCVTS